MIMKLHLNYTQSFQIGSIVPKITIYSNLLPEVQDEKIAKKSFNTKAKRFITKLSPLHWYDGVWDDLDFDIKL